MLKRARQHQIVERIFGSFPPSSPVSNLPPFLQLFLFLLRIISVSYRSLSFSSAVTYSPVLRLFSWLVLVPLFSFVASLSDRRALSLGPSMCSSVSLCFSPFPHHAMAHHSSGVAQAFSFRFSSFLLCIMLPYRLACFIHCLTLVLCLASIVALLLARQHAVVGEWMNALSAPAAEIKRADRFLLLPTPASARPARNPTEALSFLSLSLSLSLSFSLLPPRVAPTVAIQPPYSTILPFRRIHPVKVPINAQSRAVLA